jgi:hypothetical protein
MRYQTPWLRPLKNNLSCTFVQLPFLNTKDRHISWFKERDGMDGFGTHRLPDGKYGNDLGKKQSVSDMDMTESTRMS